jgi:hypothetical protein
MSQATLPDCNTLLLRRDGWRLHVTLNRPEARNAMSFAMLHELMAVFTAIAGDRSLRAVILRGAGGTFCSGGDIKDMAAARGAEPGPDGKDPLATTNRMFGRMLELVEAAPQAVIAVIEGNALGGGFGLCCVSDVAIASDDARFRLPETGLGVPPAQIAPFIVQPPRPHPGPSPRRHRRQPRRRPGPRPRPRPPRVPKDRSRRPARTRPPGDRPLRALRPSPPPSAWSSPPPEPTATPSEPCSIAAADNFAAADPRPRERRRHDSHSCRSAARKWAEA